MAPDLLELALPVINRFIKPLVTIKNPSDQAVTVGKSAHYLPVL